MYPAHGPHINGPPENQPEDALPGIEKVYNRYDYFAEKREAFERPADLIERIVQPPSDNVVNMRPRRGERAR